MSLRFLVTGSRDWTADFIIAQAMHDSWEEAGKPEAVTVVTGKCPTGADYLAGVLAVQWRWSLETHPADWVAHGRRAGYLRNAEMVSLGADVLLAFIRNDSKGASMTLDLATKAEMRTIVWRVNESGPPPLRAVPPIGL